ncbi:hypothetical protein ACTHGU_04230 [Chitinophagaceae bacterium MMS25-I14]
MKQLQSLASISLKYFFDIEEQVVFTMVQMGKFYAVCLILNFMQHNWIMELGQLKKMLR